MAIRSEYMFLYGSKIIAHLKFKTQKLAKTNETINNKRNSRCNNQNNVGSWVSTLEKWTNVKGKQKNICTKCDWTLVLTIRECFLILHGKGHCELLFCYFFFPKTPFPFSLFLSLFLPANNLVMLLVVRCFKLALSTYKFWLQLIVAYVVSRLLVMFLVFVALAFVDSKWICEWCIANIKMNESTVWAKPN